MEREIETIFICDDQSFAQRHHEKILATESNDVDAEEVWDSDEDDDVIFNKYSDAPDVEHDEDEGTQKEEAPMVSVDQVPTPAPSPPSTTFPPAPAPHFIPLPKRRHLSGNPFLMSDDNDKGENHGPAPIPAAEESNANDNTRINPVVGDGWIDEDFVDDDDMLSSSSKTTSSVPPAPSSPIPPTAALPPPIAQNTQAHEQRQLKYVARPQQPTPVPTQPTPVPTQPTNIVASNPAQRRIHQMLSNYISALHDTNFLTQLHQRLHLYLQTSSDGARACTVASDLKTYYATRPGLRKYTLGVELDRMDYELILGDGKSTKDKDSIRRYFGVGEDGERMCHDAEGAGKEEVATTEELLIRSANQSLLADMLAALTGPEEDAAPAKRDGSAEDSFFDYDEGDAGSAGLIMSGPTLCMTPVAESCHFAVDLQCGQVEAVCLLAISVPYYPTPAVTASSQGGGSSEIVVVEDGRLVLARAEVSVRFRPGAGGGDCNDEPMVQYSVRFITPLYSAGSVALQRAAVSLACDQQNSFFQNEHAEEDADYFRDGSQLRSVKSLIVACLLVNECACGASTAS